MTQDTNATGGMAIKRYKIGYHTDEWGVRSITPGGITDPSGQWVLYKDHLAALASHGQAPARATLHQIMAAAKALHAIDTPDGEPAWETLRQCEVDVWRARAERVLKVAWSIPTARQAPAQAEPAAVAGPSDWRAGVEAVAAMLGNKADDFAKEHGYDDLGGLSFGRGAHADAKLEWHSSLCELAEEVRAMLTAAPTAQPAPRQEAPADELGEVLRERDDAEDFINELLDEVLGADRPEWSSAYNRYDAMNDVRERITALHKPAVDKAWGRFESAMAAPQPSTAAQGDENA